MSIAIAIIGNKCGIVASDSREVDNGGNINDNFDKTFSLLDENVIAVQIGLLKNGLTKISDLIINWVTNAQPFRLLSDLVKFINDQLEAYLNIQTINAPDKNISILIVGRTNIATGAFKKWGIDVVETNGVFSASNHQIYESLGLAGDDSSVKSINSRRKQPYNLMKAAPLKTIAERIIDCGIDHSGNYTARPLQHIPTCGGIPMTQTIDLN